MPPYIVAEASAWGISAQAAAKAIVDAANAFHGGLGPAIEMARLEGKIAVRSAASIEDVVAAVATAAAAIAALS